MHVLFVTETNPKCKAKVAPKVAHGQGKAVQDRGEIDLLEEIEFGALDGFGGHKSSYVSEAKSGARR